MEIENFILISAEELKRSAGVIFVAAVVIMAFLWSAVGNKKENGKTRILKLFILSFSISLILSMTIFGRERNLSEQSFEWHFLWSYIEAANGNRALALQIAANILLFIPFGAALPMNFNRFHRIYYTAAAALAFSASVEIFQGVTAMGLFEFDDMLSNTLGAAVGFLIYAGAKKLYMAAKERLR